MNTPRARVLLTETRKVTFFAMVAAGVMLLSSPVRANVLTNGSFEIGPGPNPNSGSTQTFGNGSTALTGWTVLTTTQVSWDSTGAFGVPVGAGNGSYYLDVTGNNDTNNGTFSVGPSTFYTSGGVYQTFATTLGDTYDVSYALGTDSYYNSSSTPGIEAFVSDTAPSSYASLDLSSPTSESGLSSSIAATRGVWTDESFDFVATGTSTTLTLIGYSAIPIGNNQYIGLDQVSVTDAGNLSAPQSAPDSGSAAISLVLGMIAMAGFRKFRMVGAGA